MSTDAKQEVNSAFVFNLLKHEVIESRATETRQQEQLQPSVLDLLPVGREAQQASEDVTFLKSSNTLIHLNEFSDSLQLFRKG